MNSLNWVIYFLFFVFSVGGLFFIFYFLSLVCWGGGGHFKIKGGQVPPLPPPLPVAHEVGIRSSGCR